MKKSIVAIVFSLGIAGSSYTQPQPGSLVIGGSSSFNFSKSPTSVSNNYDVTFGLSPTVGRFLSDKMLLEGGIGYNLSHVRTNNTILLTRTTNHNILGSVRLTRYFQVNGQFYLTLGGFLSAGFGPSKTTTETTGITATSNSYTISSGLGATPGMAYFVTEKWIIYSTLGALGYNIVYFDNSGNISHSVGYSFATNPFSLGVKYVIK